MAVSESDRTGANRFISLWQRNLLSDASDDAINVHQRLIDAYNEPQRFYHNLSHIDHCLDIFDQVKHLLDCADATELAIWFHDAIYQPGAADNEANSAQLFKQHADSVHSPAFQLKVDELIMSTLHCGIDIDNLDCKYMIDIDLSSFGLPWEEFLRDSQNLRKEAAALTDAQYYQNQFKFQQSLLTKPHFYLTEYFIQQYEENAHRNLARYFDSIQQYIE